MDYTTLLEENKREHACSSRQMHSRYQACQQIKDGRKARGKQYDLAGVLLLVVLAKLAGMSSLLAASRMGKGPGTSDPRNQEAFLETAALRQYLQLRSGSSR